MKYCCTRPVFSLSYGCFTLSLYGMGIFGSILLLANRRLFEALDTELPNMNVTLSNGLGRSTIHALLIANLIYSSIMYIVTALLIASIIKKLPNLMIPWMASSVVNIFTCIGYSLYLHLAPEHHVWMGSLGMITVVLQALVLCVIYLFYRDLKTEYQAVTTATELVEIKTTRTKEGASNRVYQECCE